MRIACALIKRASVAVTPVLVLLATVPAVAQAGDTFPTITPDRSKAPGAAGLTDAVNGFAYYALLACAAGFLLSGATWAVGSRVGNDYASSGGKVGIATAVGAAFLIGASTAILKFAFGAGGT